MARKHGFFRPHVLGLTAISSSTLQEGGGRVILPMPLWEAAKADREAGIRNAKIICIGDSTTLGAKAVISSPAYDGNRPYSWPMRMAAELPSPNIETWCSSNNMSLANQQVYDTRWTFGSGWTFSIPTFGGSSLANSTTTDLASLAFAVPVDTIEVWTPRNTGLGSISLDIDGGTPVVVDQAGSNSYIKTTFNVTLGMHTLNCQRVSGSTFVAAPLAYDSATKSTIVYQSGYDGARVSNYTSSGTIRNAFKAHLPDLTIIDLTIGDIVSNTATATYEASMQTLIDDAKLSGDVILVTGNPINPAVYPQADQDAKWQSYRDLAAANGLNLIDIPRLLGSFAAADAAGEMADDLHPKAAYYQKIADAILSIV